MCVSTLKYCPVCGVYYEHKDSTDSKCISCGVVFNNHVIPPTTLVDFVAEINAGRKINAIKEFRLLFSVGLKEAKDAVDSIANAFQVKF